MDNIKKISKQFMTPAIEGMKKLEENQFAAILSIESQDSDGDIVRISGIDIDTYNHEGSPLKILANHEPYFDDGMPGVIGKCVELVKGMTTDLVPCLAARMEWASTELAQTYKELWEGKFLDSMSVGFLPKTVDELAGGRYDIKESMLFEASIATTPANPDCNCIKMIKSKLGKFNKFASLEASVDEIKELFANLEKHLGELDAKLTKNLEAAAKSVSRIDSHLALMGQVETKRADTETAERLLEKLASIKNYNK